MLLNVFSVLNLIVLIIIVCAQKEIGEICLLEHTNEEGECVLIEDCLKAVENITRNHLIPQRCGFQGIIPIVCCSKINILPTSTLPLTIKDELLVNKSRITGLISQQKCREYSKYVFVKNVSPILFNVETTVNKCQHKSFELIIGENVAMKNEFPHMAFIGYEPTPSDIQWACDGSLISEQYILSAAHCLYSRTLGEAKYAKLGFTGSKDSKLQQYKIVERILHPGYKSSIFYNDIALLKLEKSAEMSPYVRPACLFQEHNIVIDKVITTSWGNSEFDKINNSSLYKIVTYLINFEKCSKLYVKQEKKLPNGIKDDSQLCTDFLNRTIKYNCQENLGGTLQIYHNSTDAYCMYDILGVASFGKTCGIDNIPEVFTRVSHYLKWIEDIVWP